MKKKSSLNPDTPKPKRTRNTTGTGYYAKALAAAERRLPLAEKERELAQQKLAVLDREIPILNKIIHDFAVLFLPTPPLPEEPGPLQNAVEQDELYPEK